MKIDLEQQLKDDNFRQELKKKILTCQIGTKIGGEEDLPGNDKKEKQLTSKSEVSNS